MAGTIEYDWYILFYSGRYQRCRSLRPVKSDTWTMKNGTYRDLSQQSSQDSNGMERGYVSIPANTPLFSITDSAVTAVANAAVLVAGSDDLLHIAPRDLVEPYSVWEFLNADGDLMSSPRCVDVLNFSTFEPDVPAPTTLTPYAVTPSDTDLLPSNTDTLFIGSGGTLKLNLLTTGDVTMTVTTGQMLRLPGIRKVYATGTTASGFFRFN